MKPKYSKKNTFKNIIKWVPSSVSFYAAAAASGFALDMSQYNNLFSSTRIPHETKDELKVNPDAKHIVIQRGSDFYTFDVLQNDGTAISDDLILSNIESILSLPINAKTNEAVGALTTLDRTEWAGIRNEMRESKINQDSLDTIDGALFSIVLEHESVADPIQGCHLFLHGSGNNRWFDKSFQIIVSECGNACVNFEHSWGDGVAVLRYFEEVWRDACSSAPITTSSVMDPIALEWDLNNVMKTKISDASSKFETWKNELNFNVLESPVINRLFPKANKISPDGVMQMAIQLAHKKLKGTTVSTYESANTSAFKHGRTETIRSATKESVDFVNAMMNSNTRWLLTS